MSGTQQYMRKSDMGRSVRVTLPAVLILICVLRIPMAASAGNGAIVSETLTMIVYLDGFVQVLHDIEANQSYPRINVTLVSQTCENMLVVDDENLPLDYTVANRVALINSLGASKLRVTYLTQELTSKTGQFWSLSAEVALNSTVIIPESVTVISLNDIPEQVQTFNDQIRLVMPPGKIEIVYTAEHNITIPEQSDDLTKDGQIPFQTIGIVAFSILCSTTVVAFLALKRKKPVATEKPMETAVDVERLLAREKDLRPDEVKVIRFLADKNGEAHEAELYDKLELPRTTTWRLLKRLERMEIVEIRKSRRQNIVSISKKYLKRNRKSPN